MNKPLSSSPAQNDAEVLESAMSEVATAMADPSRVSMLCALMDGRAWTATELSAVADVAPSTASAHLTKLVQGRLIGCLSQGRHRYYRLASSEVAMLLETLMGVSMRTQPAMKISTPVHLRKARTCYDHLAGEVAVSIYAFMQEQGWFTSEGTALSPVGLTGFHQIGATLKNQTRRKTACACLDWSERRPHLGGNAGAALLAAFESHGWIERIEGYREVRFTDAGRRALARFFAIHDV
ncbi:helix-turn-helix transcriptional regulator [Kluyvera sp. EC_51]|uniref:ArsR/SmtB family transcription factor n=2 Tax=Kluyvera TaxID=579 RepID=UPI002105FDA1|nr:metalloregulator ArsR/SmtB family transcription factor [Kluyvera sp. EC_51]